ncbi:hypothetical protein AMTRI_Chr04g184340 [Amborella trichopoda]
MVMAMLLVSLMVMAMAGEGSCMAQKVHSILGGIGDCAGFCSAGGSLDRGLKASVHKNR